MVLGKHNAGLALGIRSSRIVEEEKRQKAVTKIIVRTNPFHPDDAEPEIISEKWVPQLDD